MVLSVIRHATYCLGHYSSHQPVSYHGLPHCFMILAWPLKAFDFEIPDYFMAYSSSLNHSNVTIPRILCVLHSSFHLSVTLILFPCLFVYNAVSLGEFFNFSRTSCSTSYLLLPSFSLIACFCQIYYSCSHLRAFPPVLFFVYNFFHLPFSVMCLHVLLQFSAQASPPRRLFIDCPTPPKTAHSLAPP